MVEKDTVAMKTVIQKTVTLRIRGDQGRMGSRDSTCDLSHTADWRMSHPGRIHLKLTLHQLSVRSSIELISTLMLATGSSRTISVVSHTGGRPTATLLD